MQFFLMLVGGMALCYILQDAIPSLTKRFDNDDRFITKLLIYPLVFVCYLFMVCSAPILLYMMWHDSRMERMHKEMYIEDSKPYHDTMNNVYQRVRNECDYQKQWISELKEQLIDEHHKGLEEGKTHGERSGFRTGYKTGFHSCFEQAGIDEKQYGKMFFHSFEFDYKCFKDEQQKRREELDTQS